MTGIAFLKKFRSIEEQANRLGFQITASKHFTREYDAVALKPLNDDSLPVYSRDAELFVGSIEELEVWLRGLEWARTYDKMLFGKNHEGKRERLEQQERNRQLVTVLSTSK
jgi:hypothetical protein